MKHESDGFTLVELLIVIAIIAVMAAIGIPSILSYLPKYRMNSAVRDVYSDFQTAKINAVKRKENVIINFSVALDEYTIFIDNGAGGGVANNAILDGNEAIIKTGALPTNIDLSAAAFGGAPASATGFNPRGLPFNSKIGHIQIENAELDLYKRIVMRISGNADVRTSYDGGATFE